MQIFEEENLEEVYKRFLQNWKDKEQWMIKEAAESEENPSVPGQWFSWATPEFALEIS